MSGSVDATPGGCYTSPMTYTVVINKTSHGYDVRCPALPGCNSQGEHICLSNGERRLTVPRHPRLNPYTLKAIIKDSGLTAAEFKRLL